MVLLSVIIFIIKCYELRNLISFIGGVATEKKQKTVQNSYDRLAFLIKRKNEVA